MVETVANVPFVERVRQDASLVAEALKDRDSKSLLLAQASWDQGKEIAERFGLKEKFQQTLEVIREVLHNPAVELKETPRPVDNKSSGTYELTLSWLQGNSRRDDGSVDMSVRVSGSTISVFGKIPGWAARHFIVGNVTEEEIDNALFEAYKNPRGLEHY